MNSALSVRRYGASMRTSRHAVPALALSGAVLLAGLLAGCTSSRPRTGSGTASTVGGVQQITVTASDNYRFNPSTITVHPGKVRVVLVNSGNGAPHDWQLPKYPDDNVPLTARGQTQQATFTAPSPGTYQFVCTIHEKDGQTGTLVVLPN